MRLLVFVLFCLILQYGETAMTGKISSGAIAQERQFPEIVSLQRKGLTFQSHFCGGVLVSPEAVVTSAYCVANIAVADTVVVAGVTNLDGQSGNSQQVGVSRVVLHPDYDMTRIQNDIAIVHLRLPFELNDHVKVMDLPAALEEVQNLSPCVIAGFGKITVGGTMSENLYYTNTTAITDDSCRTYHSSSIIDSHVCTQVSKNEACEGDVGGPLLCGSDRRWTGLITRGNFCGQYQLPGIFTQISYFTQFIIDEAYLDDWRR